MSSATSWRGRLGSTAAVIALLLLGHGAPSAADQRFARVAREIQQLVDDGTLPSLAVAVAKDDRIIWEAAFGWADRERRVPATPHTPYSLASISKPFTATAVMTLVEAGRLDLDRPANEYLDDPGITGDGADRATIRHLLAHTAGLPPYFRMRAATDPMPAETMVGRAVLIHPPGRRFVYSNLGYGLLDRIVERVAGEGFAGFMHRAVFEPLGLTRASVPAGSPPEGAAVRYADNDAPLPFYDLDHPGASSIYASAHDLVRFGLFHLAEGRPTGANITAPRILTAASLREMQRVRTRIRDRAGYGLGWRIDHDVPGFRRVGHTGGMPGVSAVLSLFPAERTVIAVLANRRNTLVVPLAGRIAVAAMPFYSWRREGSGLTPRIRLDRGAYSFPE